MTNSCSVHEFHLFFASKYCVDCKFPPPTAPPTITPGSASVVVTEGEVATLTCTATGDPIPDQTWSRNGTQLTSGGRYQISSDGRVLTVRQVNEEQDEGVFTCHASNNAGSNSADVAVSVQGKKEGHGKGGGETR